MPILPPSHTEESGPEPQPHIQDLITGDGPLAPVILRLAWPVVLMMYLQGAYNIIDTIWVGQLLGKFALAGIATGGFVLWSIFGLTNLVTAGIMATVARRIGEGDRKAAEYAATQGLLYALVVSLLVGVILWALVDPLFRLMGTDPRVSELGARYLRVILFGSPLIFLSFQLQRVFQAAGDTVTPMWLMFFALLINTLLDPVLMLGLFGLPRLGVAGAALATVIARLFVVAAGLWLLMRKQRIGSRTWRHPALRRLPRSLPQRATGYLRIRPRDITGWNWGFFLSTLRIGLPNAVSQTLFPLVYMILTRLPAAYGPEYVAALRIGHTVEGISFFLALGFSIATATCVGQTLGAGKPARAARSAWMASGMVTGILAVFSILFYLFSLRIGAVFSPDPGAIRASATYLEILAVSQIFMGVEIVLGGAFSGAGDNIPPLAILGPLNAARIPLAYWLAGPAALGINGVWWAISGTSVLKGLVIAFWFLRGRWKRKRV